jgi:hypothetical protein
MLNAVSVMNQCARFIVHSVYPLRVMAFTPQINSYTQPVDKLGARLTLRLRHSHVIHMLDKVSTLLASAHQGHKPRLKGVARKVAKVLVGALCLGYAQPAEAQLDAIKSVKSLAAYQLTDKQYLCHNEIIYRESRWNIDAVNGSHHGYYQLKIKAVKGKPYDYQFWMYWYYVTHRYGVTKYDEPNYCAALKHLQIKGWQ